MKKINFILLLIFFSTEIRADKAQCEKYLSKIREIQLLQLNYSSADGTVGSLQEKYDKQMAKMIILKGIQELKDDYIRNRGAFTKSNLNEDLKFNELAIKLEKDIESSARLLSLEDLMDQMETDKKLREAKNSDEFITRVENNCKGKKNTLCENLENVEPMGRGLSVSMGIEKDASSIKDYRNFIQADLPPKETRRGELEITNKAHEDLMKLKLCMEGGKKTCDQELTTLKQRKDLLESRIKKDSNLEKNQEIVNLRDSYGDIEDMVETLALQIKEQQEGPEPKRKDALDALNQRIKQNYEVANLRAQIRGNKYDEKKPPVITQKNAPEVLKDVFKTIGCSSKDLNDCLNKLSVNSSQLDREISKLKGEMEDTIKKLDKFTSKSNYQKMEEVKAILISLSQEECREEKFKNQPAFVPCAVAQENASPSKRVTNFALGMGRVIAEVDGNLFVHKNSTQIGRKNRLNSLCSENFTLVGTRFSSADFCRDIYVPGGTLVDKVKAKITGEKPQTKTQCGPAPYCMDWMSFYENYDIERDDSGKILSIKRFPTNSELVAPELAKSVLTLAPLGLQMYQSDQYLKVMQNQARHQMQVNHFRKNYPLHTQLWDQGYRGFKDGYVGGPTLQNPGVTGFGALGNPYAGYGAWNPYGMSGVLPYQLGMYSYNPYFNGNFQYGSTYSFKQLTY